MRSNDRCNKSLRVVNVIKDFNLYAEGSVLIEFGHTKVICTAKVVDKVRERYYCSKHIIQKHHLPFLEIIARSNKYTADLIYYFRFNYDEIKFLGANISEKEYNALMK